MNPTERAAHEARPSAPGASPRLRRRSGCAGPLAALVAAASACTSPTVARPARPPSGRAGPETGPAGGAGAARYDLHVDYLRWEGHGSHVEHFEEMFLWSRVGTPLLLPERTKSVASGVHFEYFEEVESIVDDRTPGRSVLYFDWASRLDGLTEVPYAFHGRAVTVDRTPAGEWRYAYAGAGGGGPLAPIELDGIRRALGRLGEGELEADRLAHDTGFVSDRSFVPERPVAVGEHWAPDIVGLAKALGVTSRDGLAPGSRADLALEKVFERDDLPTARLVGSYKLGIRELGPLRFEEPVELEIDLVMELSLDEEAEDTSLKADFRIAGGGALESRGPHAVSELRGRGTVVHRRTAEWD